MFDYNKQLFRKRQREILALANTPAGRYLLNCRVDAPIVRLTPNAIIYDWQPQLRGEFYLYERQAKILLPILTKLDILKDTENKVFNKFIFKEKFGYYKMLLHFSELERNKYLPSIFLNQQNFYTSVGGDGGTSADNIVTWAGCRGSAGTGQDPSSASSSISYTDYDGVDYSLLRGFLPVDTSAVGAGATVTAVVSNVYFSGSRDATPDDVCVFAITTQTDPTSLVIGDYDNITLDNPTEFGRSAAWSTWSAVAYTSTTFNADGRGAVNGSGYTKYGARAGYDVDNTTPTQFSYIQIYWSDQAGTANDPYFDITWTPAATAGVSGYKSLLGVGQA